MLKEEKLKDTCISHAWLQDVTSTFMPAKSVETPLPGLRLLVNQLIAETALMSVTLYHETGLRWALSPTIVSQKFCFSGCQVEKIASC